jgi:uncharacterized protein (DUF2164 family)
MQNDDNRFWVRENCRVANNLEISKQARTEAIASLKRYSRENMPEPLGDLGAALLLDFFLEEVGPLVYNQAIADAQARMAQLASELNGDLYIEEFQYWSRLERKRRG